jgi:hypothetical protein
MTATGGREQREVFDAVRHEHDRLLQLRPDTEQFVLHRTPRQRAEGSSIRSIGAASANAARERRISSETGPGLPRRPAT